MEFKGTKGEWFAVEYAGFYILQSGRFYQPSDNILDYDCYPKIEVDANAKLIAAAPELLEALQIVKANYNHFGNDSSGRKICRLEKEDVLKLEKAIKKALE